MLPFADTDTAFWQRSVPVRIGGVPSRALCPVDELLHLVVHEHVELVSPVRGALAYLAPSFATVPDRVLTTLEGRPVSPGHRLEWWARMRGPALPPGPPGYAIRHWRQYQRLQRDTGRWPTPAGFLRFVADGLRVEGPIALAADVWRQTRERVRWATR